MIVDLIVKRFSNDTVLKACTYCISNRASTMGTCIAIIKHVLEKGGGMATFDDNDLLSVIVQVCLCVF